MNLFEKSIEDFKIIEIDSDVNFDDHGYQSFLFLLNRLTKANTQNVKLAEQIQANVSCQLENSQSHIDQLLSDKHHLIEDNKLFESGIIKYADIIFSFQVALDSINQENMNIVFEPIIRTNMEILERLGFHRIKTIGCAVDSSLHSVIGSNPTQDPQQDCIICSTIREGYRRGDRILRTADVIIYKYDKEN